MGASATFWRAKSSTLARASSGNSRTIPASTAASPSVVPSSVSIVIESPLAKASNMNAASNRGKSLAAFGIAPGARCDQRNSPKTHRIPKYASASSISVPPAIQQHMGNSFAFSLRSSCLARRGCHGLHCDCRAACVARLRSDRLRISRSNSSSLTAPTVGFNLMSLYSRVCNRVEQAGDNERKLKGEIDAAIESISLLAGSTQGSPASASEASDVG